MLISRTSGCSVDLLRIVFFSAFWFVEFFYATVAMSFFLRRLWLVLCQVADDSNNITAVVCADLCSGQQENNNN